MSLSCGIVGLPNVGKSTLFNLLLNRQISPTANYPFTTIKPYTGVVAVPDSKLTALKSLIKPQVTTPATITFIDIAGLVKNAHQGEGLGNEFLGQIRNVDAIIEVVRGFNNAQVAHVMGNINPLHDQKLIDLELELGNIKKPTLYLLNTDNQLSHQNIPSHWLQLNLSNNKVDLNQYTPLVLKG